MCWNFCCRERLCVDYLYQLNEECNFLSIELLASVTSIVFSTHSGMTDDQKTSISMPGGESSFGPLDFNMVVLPNLPTTSISTTGGRSSISLYFNAGVPMPLGEYCVYSSIFIKQEDVAHQQPVTSTGRNSGEAMYPANRCFFRELGQSEPLKNIPLVILTLFISVFTSEDTQVRGDDGHS